MRKFPLVLVLPAVFSSCSQTRVRACGSAPRSASRRTMSECCWATAHISAVCPRSRSAAFTSAPWSTSISTTGRLPLRAAPISGVSPMRSVTFAFAPASSRRSTTGASPFLAASHRGVAPSALAASTSAPASINSSAAARSPRCAAQWRAVAPSPCGASTSVSPAIRSRAAARSPIRTAATRSGSAAAYANVAVTSRRTARDRGQEALRRGSLGHAAMLPQSSRHCIPRIVEQRRASAPTVHDRRASGLRGKTGRRRRIRKRRSCSSRSCAARPARRRFSTMAARYDLSKRLLATIDTSVDLSRSLTDSRENRRIGRPPASRRRCTSRSSG